VPVLTGNVDIASARLTFEGGAVANLTASRISTERMRKLRIFQRSGYLSLDLAAGTGEFLRLRGGLRALAADGGDTAGPMPSDLSDLSDIVERIPIVGDRKEPLRSELESFRDAILGSRPAVVSGEDGRAALAVTLSIEEHIRKGVEAVTYGPVGA
jgi:predicted dehydrogenase